MSETTFDLMLHPQACPEFTWIGQPLYACETCGQPYWLHSHTYKAGGSPFGRDSRRIITRAEAGVVRAKWEPLMHADGYMARPYTPKGRGEQ